MTAIEINKDWSSPFITNITVVTKKTRCTEAFDDQKVATPTGSGSDYTGYTPLSEAELLNKVFSQAAEEDGIPGIIKSDEYFNLFSKVFQGTRPTYNSESGLAKKYLNDYKYYYYVYNNATGR